MIHLLRIAVVALAVAAPAAAQTYPGTPGGALVLEVGINAPASSPQSSTLNASPNDSLFVSVSSPLVGVQGSPLFLLADFRFSAPTAPTFFTSDVWVGAGQGPTALLVGPTPPLFAAVPILPQGNHFVWALPPSTLSVPLHIVLQAVTVVPTAISPSNYLATDAIDVIF